MYSKILNNWTDFVRDHTYIITLLMSVSLIGLMVIQLYLISVEIELQQENLDKDIGEVLLDMHHRIEDDEVLSNKLIRIFSNNIKQGPEKEALKINLTRQIRELTDSVLLLHNLADLKYDFAFYHRIEDTIALSSSKNAIQPEFQNYSIKAGWRIKEALGKGMYRFGITFHNKNWYLFYQVSAILIISSIFLAILLGSFFSTLLVLQRQKKISILKNEFINNLTHELKTPIFASSVIFKIIREKLKQPNYKDLIYHLSLLEKENQQLKNKVEKVLELTALERENPNLNWQAFDIHQIIHSKTPMYELLIGAKNGTIKYQLDAKESVINGDPMHVGNIVDNLLDNAYKYCSQNPEVIISTSNKNNCLILKITDNGIGIDSKDQPYIFDKFYRVTMGNLHQAKGFGLGLSYVKMMAGIHGGTVELQSKPGSGSSFILTFPLNFKSKIEEYASQNITG